MTVTVLAPYLKQRWVDGNGNALYQGTINTYQAGSLTPIVTYKDSTGGPQNTNPIVLNARGECDLYLLPNVAYKFIVADINGNLIPGGTIDNVVNSQLITLYGGVDTGSANAYILTFVANFTSYTDGIQLTWIPASTNTGPSTININGIGVINLVNPDASALSPGEVFANVPAQILIKGGAAILITPASSSLNSFAATWTGFSVIPVQPNVFYRRTGNLAAITIGGIPLTGTSNSTLFILSGLPAIINPNIIRQTIPCMPLIDNGATVTTPSVAQVIAGGTVQFFKDPNLTGWTASGAKGFAQPISLVFPL
jgi:hypothetical protein